MFLSDPPKLYKVMCIIPEQIPASESYIIYDKDRQENFIKNASQVGIAIWSFW
jgi:hypothetical protein